MLIKHLHHEIKLNDDEINYEQVLKNIDNMMLKLQKDQVYSHLLIDGQIIEANYQEYLQKNLATITTVEIIGQSYDKAINDTVKEGINFLEIIAAELNTIAEQFYQRPSENSWKMFQKFIDDLECIIDLMSLIINNPNWSSKKEIFEALNQELLSNVNVLQQALNNSDVVLIADLIHYEFSTLFPKIAKEYSFLIQMGDEIDHNN